LDDLDTVAEEILYTVEHDIEGAKDDKVSLGGLSVD